MAAKLAPFAWLGMNGRGVFHLRVGNRVRVLVPGECVEAVEELQAIGDTRIQELISAGEASPELEIVVNGIRMRRPVDPVLLAQGKEAEGIAQASFGLDLNQATRTRANEEAR